MRLLVSGGRATFDSSGGGDLVQDLFGGVDDLVDVSVSLGGVGQPKVVRGDEDAVGHEAQAERGDILALAGQYVADRSGRILGEVESDDRPIPKPVHVQAQR